jgi:hypothetical protein
LHDELSRSPEFKRRVCRYRNDFLARYCVPLHIRLAVVRAQRLDLGAQAFDFGGGFS